MNSRNRTLAGLLAVPLAWALVSPAAAADTGSAMFDRYVQDLGARMQSVDNGSYWISTQVDRTAFDHYLGAMGQSAAGPGLTDTATFLAGLQIQPLRTFNHYLAYLGQRMQVDAGPQGAPLESNSGTGPFDRYIEEVNYRIQALYRAEDGF